VFLAAVVLALEIVALCVFWWLGIRGISALFHALFNIFEILLTESDLHGRVAEAPVGVRFDECGATGNPVVGVRVGRGIQDVANSVGRGHGSSDVY
jgi:hypothetical protein